MCALFQQGTCLDGDKCQFSHDLNLEFNQGAFDIYTDLRDIKSEFGKEFELNKIAEEKEKKRGKQCQSNIVCKFFLEAITKRIYGWKWECPNSEECQYRHSLPKDYIIKNKKNGAQEDMTLEEFLNLEEQIDAERERISKTGIPVNESTFAEWKRKREERKGKINSNKKENTITGLQLFKTYEKNNEIVADDEGAADDIKVTENIGEEIDVDKDLVENDVFFKFNIKDDENTLDELNKRLQGIKVDTELFKDEENLDELDGIEDDDEQEIKVDYTKKDETK